MFIFDSATRVARAGWRTGAVRQRWLSRLKPRPPSGSGVARMDMTTKMPWTENASEPFVDAGMEMLPGPAIETMDYDCVDLLRQAGLRPTRQRLLGWLLFSKGGRHVTAEMLH